MYESIVEKINNQNWLEATQELSALLSRGVFDEQLAVLAATIFVATGDIAQARKNITKGLELNYKNYELWLILGQTYEIFNVNQAYLCYENALFYCDNAADAEVIACFLDNMKESDAFCVNKCAIVILSYNSLPYTKECIESIRVTCPKSAYEIIVIDNASNDNSVKWLEKQQDIVLQCNEQNVGFPAGCNQGIRLAQRDSDIFLLNNDTVLPPNALFWLRMGLYENKRVGAVGSVSNAVSNFQGVCWDCRTKEEFLNKAIYNNLPMEKPYEWKTYLVGFAMIIRRKALEEVGYLDEIFSPGTYEDNDMGYKLSEKGYDVVLCRNSFIYHYGSGGGSNAQKWFKLWACNEAKLTDKWGFSPRRYALVRYDIINRIQVNEEVPLKILELGCGLGCTLLALMNRFPNAELHGIENNKNLWKLISHRLNICHCGPETGTLPYSKGYFDIIIMGETYTNSFNQVALVEKYADYLNENGVLITWEHEAWKRREVLLGKSNLAKAPSIAMCIFTHNHPDTVEYVLNRMCLNCYLHSIDVYYYDSSDDDSTREVVEAWINRGYTNLYYINVKGWNVEDKIAAAFKGEGLNKRYDYVWPSKDRTIWQKETLDAVREYIAGSPDVMYLEIRENAADSECKNYVDGIELYREYSLGLTSLDTSIYKCDSILADKRLIQYTIDSIKEFPHFYLILKRIAEMKNPKICVLQGARIVLYNVKLSKSTWEKEAFRVWKDCWIRVNEELPDCYAPYRERVIREVAGQPWLIGDMERLKELKAAGALTVDKLDEIEVNWERISDIPFEEVRKLAKEQK